MFASASTFLSTSLTDVGAHLSSPQPKSTTASRLPSAAIWRLYPLPALSLYSKLRPTLEATPSSSRGALPSTSATILLLRTPL